ncbi:MAG: DUF5615 family PIN-like protein [Saprospiraceae bacterium]|nr:DUF5615 family PIN-like protein [Saprospiraceae bacterium]
MKFVADEGVDARLVRQLRALGHDVWYFAESGQRTADADILQTAIEGARILITRDKDFGELIFKKQLLHIGVILLRLEKLPTSIRIEQTLAFIESAREQLAGQFAVLTPGAARIRPLEHNL